MAEAEVDAGDSVGHLWMILHIHTPGQGQQGRAGMEGGQPTINGLRVACPNRCQSQHEGS